MASTSKILQYVGVGALALWGLKAFGGSLANKIAIEPGSATPDLSGFPAVFRIKWDMNITNKTGVTATIYSLDGEVFFGNVKMANVSIANPVTLYAGQTRVVQFIIEVPPVQTIGDLIAATITNGLNAFLNKIRFKGVVKTSVVNVPLDMFIPIA